MIKGLLLKISIITRSLYQKASTNKLIQNVYALFRLVLGAIIVMLSILLILSFTYYQVAELVRNNLFKLTSVTRLEASSILFWINLGLGYLILFTGLVFGAMLFMGPVKHKSYFRANVFIPLIIFIRKVIRLVKKGAIAFYYAPIKKKLCLIIPTILLIFLLLIVNQVKPYFEKPYVVNVFPGNVSLEVPLDSTVEAHFSQPMKKDTVEKAISEGLKVTGSFEWIGDKKVKFTPSQKLERNTVYTISFVNTQSKYMVKLSTEVGALLSAMTGLGEYRFTTLSDPKISLTFPQTVAVEKKTPITVIFDRPMIPLTDINDPDTPIEILQITPAIGGVGKWLGTTSYQFDPSEETDLATT